MDMDIDLLIAELQKQGILSEIQKKRITTSELPATLYVKLVVSAIATKKGLANCISTALETYTMRNEEKHLAEIKMQATAVNMGVEEYLADTIAKRLI